MYTHTLVVDISVLPNLSYQDIDHIWCTMDKVIKAYNVPLALFFTVTRIKLWLLKVYYPIHNRSLNPHGALCGQTLRLIMDIIHS